ncbi:unnamed protein product [Adineta steineri]|uniref:Uncharacterized protein n=1 Tax=Adineta steineri TaxID=433720 RepID=A0A815MVA4_9BILA|nr:unnamed protein product [Adineta steineri]
MFWLIFVLSLFSVCNAILTGKVQNYIIVGDMYKSLFNVTEHQCICEMIKVNDLISALNYFSANQTCRLFPSNISTIFIESYSNSFFLFLNQSSISILNAQEYQPITSLSPLTIIPSTSPSSTSRTSSTSSSTSTTTSTSTLTSTTSKTTSSSTSASTTTSTSSTSTSTSTSTTTSATSSTSTTTSSSSSTSSSTSTTTSSTSTTSKTTSSSTSSTSSTTASKATTTRTMTEPTK